MRVVHINYSDVYGGAAIACERINAALGAAGVDSKILVVEKKLPFKVSKSVNSSRLMVKWAWVRFMLEQVFFLKFLKAPKALALYSSAYLGQDISSHSYIAQADIIVLHWVNNSFLRIKDLQKIAALGKPIVWHMHDMWTFTGGCHHAFDCKGFTASCGNCSYLRFAGENDRSHHLMQLKTHLFKNHNFHLVSPSIWLQKLAAQSALAPFYTLQHISNTIDCTVFKPNPRQQACAKLKLDVKKQYLLFGAANTGSAIKGMQFLIEALQLLPHNDSLEVLVFGKPNAELIAKIPFKTRELGYVSHPEKMIALYNAASCYITPSLADNLPNTVMEALSCGLPVVAFNTGGIPEMVDHMKNGFIVAQKNAEQLAQGITWALNCGSQTREAAQSKVLQHYDYPVVAKKYMALFQSLLPV